MEYRILAQTYFELEKTASLLEKQDKLAELLKQTPSSLLRKVVYLATGEIFPAWMQKELNMADKLAISAIIRATGASIDGVKTLLRAEGDLGIAAEKLLVSRKQATLFKQALTVEEVYSIMEKIADAEGAGSVDKKVALLSNLISNAEPEEARYLIRTLLGQLRIGVGEGIVRDAISKAFDIPVNKVERAYFLLNDFGEVAELAAKQELDNVSLKPGRPLKAMLYPKSESVNDAAEKVGLPLQAEYKYDGFRTQIHKIGNKVKIFTRRLDDVTAQFPDIVNAVLKSVNADVVIFDSESVGVLNGKFVPFQKISQRIKRKYDVNRMSKEVPVETRLFDVLYLNGETLIEKPLKERFDLLKTLFTESEQLKLVDYIQTSSLEGLEDFYKKALDSGVEGLMIKSLDSQYQPGKRVGFGYKLKPKAETLDLVIVGAEWGQGKRANWLSSFLLACRSPETGEFLTVGKMATGLTDEEFKAMTERLKDLIIREEGQEVKIRPRIVMEVGYQEIQKSTKYDSRFALRFPRMIRIREDRSPEDVDTVERVAYLYSQQFK